MSLLIPRWVEKVATSGLDTLHVSIDGATKSSYELIRKRAKIERVLCNLQMVVDVKERIGHGRPHLKMVMVIMRINLEELPDLVRLAHQFGMEEIFVQHRAHDFGEGTLPPEIITQKMAAKTGLETIIGS